MTISFNLAQGGDPIDGEVFCYDPATDTLVLIENKVGAHIASYRYIKGASIDKASVRLSGSHVPPEPLPAISDDIMKRIREKERDTINKEKQRCAEQIGAGVPREAQLLFNGLAKTMQCVWQGRDIVVDSQRTCGGVKIAEPYTVDTVSGQNAQLVSRVKKVLEGEKAKLAA